MGKILDDITAGMQADQNASANPASSSPATPVSQPAQQPVIQPTVQLAQPAAQPAASPAPTTPAAAAPAVTTPAAAPTTPAGEKKVEETPEGPQAQPVEAVIAPITSAPAAPALSDKQQAHIKFLYEETQQEQGQRQEEGATQAQGESKISKENELLIQQAKDALSDPLVKLVQRVRTDGGDLKQLIKEAGLEDVDSLTAEEIVERELRNIGTPEEEIDAEVAKTLGGKTRLELNAIIAPLKAKQKEEQKQKSSQFFASSTNDAPNNNIVEINNRAIQTLEGLKEQYVGKEVLGMEMDEAKWDTVKRDIINGNGYAVPVFDKSNKLTGYDLDRSIMFSIFENYYKTILKNHVELGKLMGFNDLYDQRKRPSIENTSGAEVTSTPNADAAVAGLAAKRTQNKNDWNQDKKQ